MPQDEDKFTKKEEELIEALRRDRQVILDDLNDLKKLGKKMEKVLGVFTPN